MSDEHIKDMLNAAYAAIDKAVDTRDAVIAQSWSTISIASSLLVIAERMVNQDREPKDSTNKEEES